MNSALIFGVNVYPGLRVFGAHRIATFLRKHEWDVEVIDYTLFWTLDELKYLIDTRINKQTKFIAFSCFFNSWHENLDIIIKYVKNKYDITIILGGNSVLYTKCKAQVDYWVDGYGENAILAIVGHIVGNSKSKLKYDIAYLPSKKVIKALDSYPAHQLKDFSKIFESRDFLQPYEFITTEFSRGCKFKCRFCNYPILGVKDDNSVTKESFDYEARHNYDNYGIENYYVADETFNDREEKIVKIADVVEKLPFKPFFSGYIRPDLLVTNPDHLEHLARMNFGGQYYGVETFSKSAAKIAGKGMHPQKIKDMLLYAEDYFSKRIFYRGTTSIIVGLPTETKETIIETFDWLLENWKDQAVIMYALDVTDAKKLHENNYTNVSEFSLNLFKYGLREMPEQVNKVKTDNSYYYDWKTPQAYYDNFLWEHDGMNIFEAINLANSFNDTYANYFKTNNWMLHEYGIKVNKKIDLTTTYTIDRTDSLASHEDHMRHINCYKSSKLS